MNHCSANLLASLHSLLSAPIERDYATWGVNALDIFTMGAAGTVPSLGGFLITTGAVSLTKE